MPTIIGNTNLAQPTDFAPALIYLTKYPGKTAWDLYPDFELESCTLSSGSSTSDVCEVKRRYGNVKRTYETALTQQPAYDLTGYWLRLDIPTDQGYSTQFIGEIEAQSRKLMGSETQPAGEQRWIAAGGPKTLQRQYISEAVFYNSTLNKYPTVGWIPAINERDKRGLLVGNMTTDGDGDSFYGGNSVWDHLSYLKYLVNNFIQQKDPTTHLPTGLIWTIGGQADVLSSIKSSIRFPDKTSAAEMLKELIPVRFGLDFIVQPTGGGTGFEITVFSLTASSMAFDSQSFPANPNTVELVRSAPNLNLFETHIVEAIDRRYDKIVALGKRIVVCGSLRGARAFGGQSLVPKWSTAIESEYDNPAGTSATVSADAIRQSEYFRDVYSRLGTPLDWDMDGGAFGVGLGPTGQPVQEYPQGTQTAMRETLHWIPLKTGFDYSTSPPTDNTDPDAVQSDIQPLMAWIKDECPQDGSKARYVPCHKAGIHVRAPFQDWGVCLDASPNHKVGLNHFGATNSQLTPTQFDYETTIATIAMESDTRISLTYTIPDNLKAGDGTVMVIEDREAEYWYALEGTFVKCGEDGKLVEIDGHNKILRDDSPRLALLMAGAIIRYSNERARAVITMKGFWPFGNLLGQILTVIQQGDDITDISAPITSVSWIPSPSPTTIIRTGYA